MPKYTMLNFATDVVYVLSGAHEPPKAAHKLLVLSMYSNQELGQNTAIALYELLAQIQVISLATVSPH